MILNAVNGKPTTAPSRIEHFRTRARASTQYRELESNSSESEGGAGKFADSEAPNTTDHGELGDSSSFGESDSAGEMALISASFKSVAASHPSGLVATTSQAESIKVSSQETDTRSQDITLPEVRDQTRGVYPRAKPRPRKQSDLHDSLNVEFLCARSSSPKSDGPDHSSRGQRIHSATPTWSGVMFVERIFPNVLKELWKCIDTTGRKNN